MKRWHQEAGFSARRFWGYVRLMTFGTRFTGPEIGRFRKRAPLDCGNPQCGLCHGDKYPKRSKTSQEVLSDLDFREQLEELD